MAVREYIILPSSHPAHRVLHLTSSAQIGGTERMLLRFLERCNRKRMLHYVAAMQPQGPLLDAVAELGFESIGLTSQNPFNPSVRGELRALLREKQFSLMHSYGLRADVLGRGIAHGGQIEAYVSAIRSPDPWRKPWHVWLDRWTARGGRVNLFISNSEAGRRSRIQREKFPSKKIVTIPNGIDLPAMAPLSREEAAALRAQYGLTNKDHPLVAVISNLRPMKGHLDLVEAIGLLKGSYPDLRFIFAGRDDSGGAIEEAARLTGVNRHIIFAGFVMDPLPLVRLADVYCMPSHWEGCPTALLEAMALGKPIVATRVGGIPELVRHDQEALLIPPSDPPSLANGLDRLFKNGEEAQRLGQNALRRAHENFTLDQMVQRIEAAYKNLLRH